MGGFRQDPDYVTVLALENYDDETGQAAKAPIFSQRVNQRPQRPTRADSPARRSGSAWTPAAASTWPSSPACWHSRRAGARRDQRPRLPRPGVW